MRAAYAERSNGEIILGPPKSKAGRRIDIHVQAEHCSDGDHDGPEGRLAPVG